jgi:hypothetical protein
MVSARGGVVTPPTGCFFAAVISNCGILAASADNQPFSAVSVSIRNVTALKTSFRENLSIV